MKILILGGTSFIGPAIVHTLLQAGHEITVFHRGRTEADLPAGVRHIHWDEAGKVRDRKLQILPQFTQVFRELAPEVICYTVPLGEKDAQTVMQTFKGIARRIVALSSQDVYRAYGRLLRTEPGPPDPVPLSEDAPLRERLYPHRQASPRPPDDPTAFLDDYDKILAERAILGEKDLPGTILRLPMVYGPGDYQHRLFEYLKRMDDGRPAILLPASAVRWRWTRGYVENVADAVALAIDSEQASGRIYNVGEEPALSLAEWVCAIGDACGWQGEIVIRPEEQFPAHMVLDIDTRQDLVADTTRIRRELGYRERVSQPEALRRTIAWERAHPPAKIEAQQFDYAGEDAILAR
ncbi:MAG: NAD-dependent epimerase/dehydratase family protein [Ktedonobacteraceae bacterium]|nr:NAD-dependent epimerase/dehydratase family protein [Ktedonobacteraceae bacterium]